MEATTTPKLLNFKDAARATSGQLARVLEYKLEKANNVLKCEVDANGFLLIHYRTKGGYFITAIFKQDAQLVTKHSFHNWNEIDGVPFKPVNFKD
jgi:hypothetical protein